ncbi:gliding motility-associated-like protein [Leeuwenhoekiella aestuarii]|uniref:T9SS type B sorting domain-containing protein n=1 Tax=Leeuwenhoekiella aestuarii TaxID=2249426 RepID=UPI000FFEA81D|nr:T9SS type B sorting domain-containing protein [Leeuwenhoekiella aestuarii]RXG16126.1 gliding motility-associated-like protein [Leeuwenhoekiella aestuarii]
MRSIPFFLFFFLSVSINAFSQSQANNWYFGNGAGLNFSTATPTVLTDGQLNTLEGCATISDDDGNLLFYTDGITVYAADHSIMQNGTNLFGNPSSTQSAIIIPQPNTPGIYYIFTVDTRTQPDEVSEGLNYSIVDFNSNPDGVVTTKNNKLLNFSSEKLSAVIKSCVTNSVWMVTFSSASGNENLLNTIYAYELSNTGLNTTPVKSQITVAVQDPRGNLKFSPDGSKLAIANAADGLFLADFDPNTGVVSSASRLVINGTNYASYGVEFSPNNRYLYVSSSNNEDSRLPPGNHFSTLLQYDTEATDISTSQIVLDEQSYYRGSLQLGPNAKIYRALSTAYQVGSNYLGVIENPNSAGLAANYNDKGINLGSGISYQGLPPFNQSLFNELDIIQNDLDSKKLDLCDGNNYTLGYEPVTGASYSWYKDDVLIAGETGYELEITQPTGVTLPYTETYEFRLDPNDGSCEKVGVAEVTYYAYPPKNPTILTQCEDAATADGFSIFNLTEAEEQLTGNDPDFTITYHETLNEAQLNLNILDPIGYKNTAPTQTLYARIENPAGCAVSVDVTLVVSSTVANSALLEDCDLDDTGFGEFDLSEANTQVLSGIIGSYTVNYYASEEAALLEDANLKLPTIYTNQTPYKETVYARVENNNSCFAISPVALVLIPRPDFSLEEEAIYCAVNFPELETYDPDYSNLDTSRTYIYKWLPEGQTTPYLETNLATTHTLRITDVVSGCFREESITILEKELAVIEHIEVTDATENNTATFTISGNGEYQLAIDNEFGPYQDDTTFYNLAPGFHRVYVRSKENCGIIEQEFSIIGFSKYFTPNGDGYHDYWQIQGISDLIQPNTVIRIFDRYGKLLKELNPLSEGWDGTYIGENLPSDDYWFRVLLEDGREFKSHFTLKR